MFLVSVNVPVHILCFFFLMFQYVCSVSLLLFQYMYSVSMFLFQYMYAVSLFLFQYVCSVSLCDIGLVQLVGFGRLGDPLVLRIGQSQRDIAIVRTLLSRPSRRRATPPA